MKRVILTLALVFGIIYLNAQDEAVIQLYATQKKWEQAKEQVDKWLADPKLKDKDKPTAYLWKLTVYSQLFVDSSLSQKYPDAKDQAIDALNKYVALDPTLKQMKEQNFASGVGNLYSGSFDKGREAFNAKDWQTAFKNFSEAERLGDFLLSNKLSSNTATVDTVTVLYTGYAAQNAQLTDSAAKYYGILADLKVSGKDYEDIYKYLIQYYSDKKDDANFKKYLAEAKELYPNDSSVWTQFEMGNLTENADLPKLLAQYQQDVAAGNMNEDKYASYGQALATNDKDQLDKLDSTQKVNLKIAAAQAFSKAYELDSANGLYAFNTGVIYYGIYSDLDDRYHANQGEGAALKANRAAISKQETAYSDTAAEWLGKAYNTLKAKTDRSKVETVSLNRAVDYLANIYYWKRDQTKVNGDNKDYDVYDGLYKKYDAEHNSYQ
ncbi:MAG TPA: hypothetical protein VHB70_06735 [Parafilimonas sp.]|nr:hypothetical protein [Parafilimonas sp.]